MPSSANKREREFQFSDRDFNRIRQLVSQHTGISLSEAKRDMVYSRLARRLREVDLQDFGSYCSLIDSPKGEDELLNFTNAITTNLTSFFREPHHFEYLQKTLLPELMKTNAQTRRLRIWSAGCSTGEEPYSIALAIREVIPENSDWDIKILATDLDSNVLAKGQSGIYDAERIAGLSKQRARNWFLRGKGDKQNLVRVHPALQEMISFKRLNLMNEWPIKGPFDFMFCRNVVIYFDKPTQSVLFDRYADLLVDDARLFLGHSETMFKVCDRFKLIGNTIYQKLK
ncbi:CheR family methyltransferase [Sulfuriflexus mobilis]|uniref:CheR family methyltransferase n=1 Tax=Sulfuriflexus mobilis TaxID=1811807 RepID=UPI000F834CD9|nr:protein-glutamate O-methyltransferase [Sulfuriflexus mobilis]